MLPFRRRGRDRPRDIVLCADPPFEVPLAVTLASIAESCPEPRELRVTVLSDGLGGRARGRLRASASALSITFVDIGDLVPHDLPVAGPFTRATYGRLYITQCLPRSSTRVLYLDCDLLVRDDVRLLLRMPLRGRLAAAARSALIPTAASDGGMPNWKQLGKTGNEAYFNTGVMVVDCARWRDAGATERVVAYAKAHADGMPLPDQDAINAVVGREILEAPLRWNQERALRTGQHRLAGVLGEAEIHRAIDDPAIIHFTGPRKPWLPHPGDPAAHLWTDALRRVGHPAGRYR